MKESDYKRARDIKSEIARLNKLKDFLRFARKVWVYTIFAHFHTIPSLYLLYPCSWTLTAIAEIVYFIHAYKDSMKIFTQPQPAEV